MLRADGQQQEEYHLAPGLGRDAVDPVWSPDVRWLAFSGTSRDGEEGHWLIEVGTWSGRRVDLAPDGVVVDWVAVGT